MDAQPKEIFFQKRAQQQLSLIQKKTLKKARPSTLRQDQIKFNGCKATSAQATIQSCAVVDDGLRIRVTVISPISAATLISIVTTVENPNTIQASYIQAYYYYTDPLFSPSETGQILEQNSDYNYLYETKPAQLVANSYSIKTMWGFKTTTELGFQPTGAEPYRFIFKTVITGSPAAGLKLTYPSSIFYHIYNNLRFTFQLDRNVPTLDASTGMTSYYRVTLRVQHSEILDSSINHNFSPISGRKIFCRSEKVLLPIDALPATVPNNQNRQNIVCYNVDQLKQGINYYIAARIMFYEHVEDFADPSPSESRYLYEFGNYQVELIRELSNNQTQTIDNICDLGTTGVILDRNRDLMVSYSMIQSETQKEFSETLVVSVEDNQRVDTQSDLEYLWGQVDVHTASNPTRRRAVVIPEDKTKKQALIIFTNLKKFNIGANDDWNIKLYYNSQNIKYGSTNSDQTNGFLLGQEAKVDIAPPTIKQPNCELAVCGASCTNYPGGSSNQNTYQAFSTGDSIQFGKYSLNCGRAIGGVSNLDDCDFEGNVKTPTSEAKDGNVWMMRKVDMTNFKHSSFLAEDTSNNDFLISSSVRSETIYYYIHVYTISDIYDSKYKSTMIEIINSLQIINYVEAHDGTELSSFIRIKGKLLFQPTGSLIGVFFDQRLQFYYNDVNDTDLLTKNVYNTRYNHNQFRRSNRAFCSGFIGTAPSSISLKTFDCLGLQGIIPKPGSKYPNENQRKENFDTNVWPLNHGVIFDADNFKINTVGTPYFDIYIPVSINYARVSGTDTDIVEPRFITIGFFDQNYQAQQIFKIDNNITLTAEEDYTKGVLKQYSMQNVKTFTGAAIAFSLEVSSPFSIRLTKPFVHSGLRFELDKSATSATMSPLSTLKDADHYGQGFTIMAVAQNFWNYKVYKLTNNDNVFSYTYNRVYDSSVYCYPVTHRADAQSYYMFSLFCAFDKKIPPWPATAKIQFYGAAGSDLNFDVLLQVDASSYSENIIPQFERITAFKYAFSWVYGYLDQYEKETPHPQTAQTNPFPEVCLSIVVSPTSYHNFNVEQPLIIRVNLKRSQIVDSYGLEGASSLLVIIKSTPISTFITDFYCSSNILFGDCDLNIHGGADVRVHINKKMGGRQVISQIEIIFQLKASIGTLSLSGMVIEVYIGLQEQQKIDTLYPAGVKLEIFGKGDYSVAANALLSYVQTEACSYTSASPFATIIYPTSTIQITDLSHESKTIGFPSNFNLDFKMSNDFVSFKKGTYIKFDVKWLGDGQYDRGLYNCIIFDRTSGVETIRFEFSRMIFDVNTDFQQNYLTFIVSDDFIYPATISNILFTLKCNGTFVPFQKITAVSADVQVNYQSSSSSILATRNFEYFQFFDQKYLYASLKEKQYASSGQNALYVFSVIAPEALSYMSKFYIQFGLLFPPLLNTKQGRVDCYLNERLTACVILNERRVTVYIPKSIDQGSEVIIKIDGVTLPGYTYFSSVQSYIRIVLSVTGNYQAQNYGCYFPDIAASAYKNYDAFEIFSTINSTVNMVRKYNDFLLEVNIKRDSIKKHKSLVLEFPSSGMSYVSTTKCTLVRKSDVTAYNWVSKCLFVTSRRLKIYFNANDANSTYSDQLYSLQVLNSTSPMCQEKNTPTNLYKMQFIKGNNLQYSYFDSVMGSYSGLAQESFYPEQNQDEYLWTVEDTSLIIEKNEYCSPLIQVYRGYSTSRIYFYTSSGVGSRLSATMQTVGEYAFNFTEYSNKWNISTGDFTSTKIGYGAKLNTNPGKYYLETKLTLNSVSTLAQLTYSLPLAVYVVGKLCPNTQIIYNPSINPIKVPFNSVWIPITIDFINCLPLEDIMISGDLQLGTDGTTWYEFLHPTQILNVWETPVPNSKVTFFIRRVPNSSVTTASPSRQLKYTLAGTNGAAYQPLNPTNVITYDTSGIPYPVITAATVTPQINKATASVTCSNGFAVYYAAYLTGTNVTITLDILRQKLQNGTIFFLPSVFYDQTWAVYGYQPYSTTPQTIVIPGLKVNSNFDFKFYCVNINDKATAESTISPIMIQDNFGKTLRRKFIFSQTLTRTQKQQFMCALGELIPVTYTRLASDTSQYCSEVQWPLARILLTIDLCKPTNYSYVASATSSSPESILLPAQAITSGYETYFYFLKDYNTTDDFLTTTRLYSNAYINDPTFYSSLTQRLPANFPTLQSIGTSEVVTQLTSPPIVTILSKKLESGNLTLQLQLQTSCFFYIAIDRTFESKMPNTVQLSTGLNGLGQPFLIFYTEMISSTPQTYSFFNLKDKVDYVIYYMQVGEDPSQLGFNSGVLTEYFIGNSFTTTINAVILSICVGLLVLYVV